ncbi:uncharacterized protein LOC114743413 isoform X2 [Neltuma alba]|uniref:uncharacterized protein LOC114743413 isoform X2 n=1 Tax=Neltuma alba TaxID=207710 RepID=UPI0010A559E2|nr:uncharacterized protein LOC114743413 isoform X2 [Prosopis alba]
MPRNEEKESVPILSSSNRVITRPDPFLVACKCFSLLTSLAAILCTVVNGLSAIKSFRHVSGIFDGVFRCYAVLISCFVVLAETEWGLIMKSFKALEYWPCRGMLQIFVAVMTRAFPNFGGERIEVILQNVACYMLLACGVLHVVSGILCSGFMKRAREQRETLREQAAKDLEQTWST